MRTEVKTASKPSLPNAFIAGPVRIPPGFPLKTCGNDELASELPTCSFILVCERMLMNSFVVNLLSCASSQLLRVLQKLFDFQQESSAAMTIADAVVRRQRSFNDWTHADHPIQGTGPLGNPTETHEGHLRRIDHAENRFDALLSQVGDGNRPIGKLRAPQVSAARAVDQVEHALHQFVQTFPIDIVNRRIDEPALAQRNRHADVNTFAWLERFIDPEPVQFWCAAQRQRHDANE